MSRMVLKDTRRNKKQEDNKVDIKEIIKDFICIQVAMGKRMLMGLIEPKQLLIYGIMLRLNFLFWFSIILSGKVMDTMSSVSLYKTLSHIILVIDVYTVLITVVRSAIELKKQGIVFSLKLNTEEDYEDYE